MHTLGISRFYHDAAAAFVKDGEIVAAAREVRSTRKEYDFDFPIHATCYCLREEKITLQDLDYGVFYDKPFIKFERIL